MNVFAKLTLKQINVRDMTSFIPLTPFLYWVGKRLKKIFPTVFWNNFNDLSFIVYFHFWVVFAFKTESW